MKTVGTLESDSLNDRRRLLLNHIMKVPGIRYRELLKASGFSNGVLSYHLTGLEEADLIRAERKRTKITRYYPNVIDETESVILSYLRHPPLREIILFILQGHDRCSFLDIVNFTGKAMSTVSSHLTYLRKEEIISTKRNGQGFLYSLANPHLVAYVASKYEMNLIEKSINNFIGMVDEL